MPGNHRRHANVMPIASIAMWIVICGSLLAAGLGYVALKNQLHSGAAEVKRLEKEIAQVEMRMSVVKIEIDKLSAAKALEDRYKSDRKQLGGLRSIDAMDIVWVDRPLPVPAIDSPEIQQTSNQR